MPYSRVDLINAFRAENPDAKDIPDNKIFAAIAVEDPVLAKGISELQPPASPDRSITNPNVIGPMLGGVGPTALGDRIMGGVAAVVNGLFPAGDTKRNIPPPAMTPDQEIGAKTVAVAGAADLAGSAVKSLASSVKARMTPPISPAMAIEQKITGGKAASAATAPHIADIAPDLAKDPELVAAKPGDPFRRTLYRKLQDAGLNVGTVEAAVPDTMPVPKQPILDGLQQLKDVFDRSKAVKASAIVESQMNRLIDTAGGADTITWGEFSPIKQQLGQDLKEMGVWKRLGTEAQKTTDVALARSYGQYMKATSDISPDLAAANGQYSLLHDATRFSKIDPSTGRYLAEVGEIKPTIWDKAKPWAIRGALGGSLYSLYRDIVR